VVGDFLYGAPHRIRQVAGMGVGLKSRPSTVRGEEDSLSSLASLTLERNFLHAAELEFVHPRSGKSLSLEAELPEELKVLLEQLRGV
jgi:23S rRNA pseudouridine1911/1915/1917 synthase